MFFLRYALYSNSSSTIAITLSLIMSDLFPACFCSTNNFNRLHNSVRSDGKSIVFEIPEAAIKRPSDLSNLISVLSQIDLLPGTFTSKYFSLAKLYNNFLFDKVARSTISFLLDLIFESSPFNSNCLPVSRIY